MNRVCLCFLTGITSSLMFLASPDLAQANCYQSDDGSAATPLSSGTIQYQMFSRTILPSSSAPFERFGTEPKA